jgi:hypothetical protein
MRIPRFIFISLAWFTTAAAMFGLGRLTSSAPRASSSGLVSSHATPALAPALPQHSPAAADNVEGERSKVPGFATPASSIEEATGGRTLDQHLKHLLAIDDEAVRLTGLLRLMEVLNEPAQLKEALDVVLADRSSRWRPSELGMLLQKWTKLEPEGAAAYAAGLRDWSRVGALNAVASTWLKSDPNAAIAWAQSQPPENAGGNRGPDGNLAIATMIGPLARMNLDQAIQLANAQPVSVLRGRMVETLVSELVAQRGPEAARNAIFDLADDPFRAGMAAKLAEQLAQSDPKSTATWAWSLPPGDTRQRAIAESIKVWTRADPVAAGQHLAQLGASPELDPARQEYARRVIREDPAGAMAWALSISNAKQRTDTALGLLRDWMRRDGNSARAWASENGIQLDTGAPSAAAPARRGG